HNRRSESLHTALENCFSFKQEHAGQLRNYGVRVHRRQSGLAALPRHGRRKSTGEEVATMWGRCHCPDVLKEQLERQLHLAWLAVRGRDRTRTAVEIRARENGRVRILERGMIQNIEPLGAELQRYFLGKPRVFQQRSVKVPEVWPNDGVAPRVAV